MSRDRLCASGLAVPVLLSLAALSVALSLYEAAWSPGLAALPWLVVAGVAFGWLAVRSVLPSWVMHLTSLALGFLATVFLAAHYVISALPLGEAAQLVVYRLGRWMYLAYSGLPSEDALPFSLLLGLCLWMAFYFSAWLIYRSGKVWWAVAGPAAALLVNTYYAEGTGAGQLVIYAFCSLLLVVRVSLQSLTEDWRLARIPHDGTVGDDFLIDATYLVAAVLVAAWVLPPLTLEQKAAEVWVRLEKPWRNFQHHWQDLFPTTGGGASARTSVYGDSLELGGPVRLTDEPLYVVDMPERYRLQAMVYDLYDGREWWSSASTVALVEPEEYPTAEPFVAREYVQQKVAVVADARSLIAAPSPRWFSLPVKSEHVLFPIDPGHRAIDIYATTARETLAAGSTYLVLSAVSRASESELRAAGTTYPAWLPSVYFSLPSSVPARVAELAGEITSLARTPYDKAEALESYLRQLEYSVEVEAPPGGRDSVDYFLFDSRVGYCNYFASAMVVMARSLGIPARVAAGYVPGQYDSERGGYLVLGSGGHAWPQLFFPGYGWIDFEPTPSQDVIVRVGPQEDPDSPDAGEDDTLGGGPGADEMLDPYLEMYGDDLGPMGEASSRQPGPAPWAAMAAAAVVLLSASVLLLWVLPRRHWSTAERVYGNLSLVAWALGVRRRRPETASEYGARVAAALPAAADDVSAIVSAFCRSRYGGSRRLAADEDAALSGAWQSVARAARRTAALRLGLSRAAR